MVYAQKPHISVGAYISSCLYAYMRMCLYKPPLIFVIAYISARLYQRRLIYREKAPILRILHPTRTPTVRLPYS